MKRNVLAIAVGLALAAGGCQPTVKRVCGHLEDASCDVPYHDCVDDGEALEERAAERSCSDLFGEYLSCIDDAGCAYESVCEIEAEAVFDCVSAE